MSLEEITSLEQYSALDFLRQFYPHIDNLAIAHAVDNNYRLFALLQNQEIIGMLGLHFYPHLSEGQRAWIHDVLIIDTKENQNIKLELIAGVKNICIKSKCFEYAIHTLKDDINNNIYYEIEGTHFAYVFQWTKQAWLYNRYQYPQISDNFQFDALKYPTEVELAWSLLKHFHPHISSTAINQALENGYQIFGLKVDGELSGVATLISYPNLAHQHFVWLQDGMIFPTRKYKKVASTLLIATLDECFKNGYSQVTVHAQVKNKRIHKFYQEYGGLYIADAYKWKV